MIRLSRHYRVLALVWAVLQFALPSAVTLVDATSAVRSGSDAVAHVEGSSSKSCRPPHSAECGLCRYVSAHVTNDGDVGQPTWPLVKVAAPVELSRMLHAGAARSLPPSRAPPLV